MPLANSGLGLIAWHDVFSWSKKPPWRRKLWGTKKDKSPMWRKEPVKHVINIQAACLAGIKPVGIGETLGGGISGRALSLIGGLVFQPPGNISRRPRTDISQDHSRRGGALYDGPLKKNLPIRGKCSSGRRDFDNQSMRRRIILWVGGFIQNQKPRGGEGGRRQ